MTKFGWTIAFLIVVLIGAVVGAMVFFMNRPEPISAPTETSEVVEEPVTEVVQPLPDTHSTSTASSTEASSTPL